MPNLAPGQALLLCFVLLSAAWGVLGWLDTARIARAGYSLNGDVVRAVRPGGPAERAGLRAGDRIIGIERPPPGDPSKSSIPGVGETRRMTVRRGDRELVLQLEHEALPAGQVMRRQVRSLAGFAVLLGTAWLGMRSRAAWARALAFAGPGVALVMMSSPILEPAGLRTAVGIMRNAVILAGVGALLHGLLLFLYPGNDTAGRRVAIYLPLALYWLLLVARMLAGDETPRIIASFIAVGGVLMFGVYLAIALGMLARFWVGRYFDRRG